MVNSTILDSIPLNNSIVQRGLNYFTDTTRSVANKITEFITSAIPQSWMANLILLIIACLTIFLASKITQKFAKIGLYILGLILVIGTFMNFV